MKKSIMRMLLAALSLAVMLGMGSFAFAAEGDGIADGTYQLNGIKGSSGMMGVQQPATLEVSGDNATLTMDIGGTALKRYDQIYIGNYSDITDENKDTISSSFFH